MRMTIDDLRRVLAECAGENDGELSGDMRGRGFDELGYDSLALMETAARIAAEYGVRLSDDDVAGLRTPDDLLDAVNRAPASS
ncbi:acyl carrier protein [Saccharopolyspora sp. NPDC047091]|uniref:acyl carrier protein n=1 Tax=Saccharopolyspora sp. NPDC047091 TaxID=3155924 RepID=UPI0033ED6E44